MSPFTRPFRRIAGPALCAVAALALSAPASAQFSAGFKFLEAVKKKDGGAVEQALSLPGATIVNTRDVSTGRTALHLVTERRDRTWMQYLLAKGANVNARDNRGVTPLQLAANLGFIEGVELLVQFRADTEQANDAGETPLISAVHRHDLAMTRMLLAGGADPIRPDSSGRSATDYAKLEGQEQLTTALVAATKQKTQRASTAPSYGPKL